MGAFVRELDNGVVDANGDRVETLSWSRELDCWTHKGTCMPTSVAFDVKYAAYITRP